PAGLVCLGGEEKPHTVLTIPVTNSTEVELRDIDGVYEPTLRGTMVHHRVSIEPHRPCALHPGFLAHVQPLRHRALPDGGRRTIVLVDAAGEADVRVLGVEGAPVAGGGLDLLGAEGDNFMEVRILGRLILIGYNNAVIARIAQLLG